MHGLHTCFTRLPRPCGPHLSLPPVRSCRRCKGGICRVSISMCLSGSVHSRSECLCEHGTQAGPCVCPIAMPMPVQVCGGQEDAGVCVCLLHGGLGARRCVRSPDRCYCASLLLLAGSRSVTFHASICMRLTACVCPWEESVKGQQKQPLGNTGSNPEATHRGAGCQGVTNPNPWSFLSPRRAQPGSPSSSFTPTYPRSPPG